MLHDLDVGCERRQDVEYYHWRTIHLLDGEPRKHDSRNMSKQKYYTNHIADHTTAFPRREVPHDEICFFKLSIQ